MINRAIFKEGEAPAPVRSIDVAYFSPACSVVAKSADEASDPHRCSWLPGPPGSEHPLGVPVNCRTPGSDGLLGQDRRVYAQAAALRCAVQGAKPSPASGEPENWLRRHARGEVDLSRIKEL